jgi:hypothetical protein
MKSTANGFIIRGFYASITEAFGFEWKRAWMIPAKLSANTEIKRLRAWRFQLFGVEVEPVKMSLRLSVHRKASTLIGITKERIELSRVSHRRKLTLDLILLKYFLISPKILLCWLFMEDLQFCPPSLQLFRRKFTRWHNRREIYWLFITNFFLLSSQVKFCFSFRRRSQKFCNRWISKRATAWTFPES